MISIIIPTYNSKKWVRTAIDSALGQTRLSCDLEIIVIDDASIDGTADYIESSYGKRVRVIRQDENRGVSAARNVGISSAKGDYVSFLDSDDWLAPDRFALLKKTIETSGADIAADCYQWVSEFGESRYPPKLWFESDSAMVSAHEFVRYDLGSLKSLGAALNKIEILAGFIFNRD